ncbi:MAG: hypothetical protein PHC51_11700 [bacterium]|nr:hypothetical protein [bacterium]
MKIGTRKSLRQILVSGSIPSQSIILIAVLAATLMISSLTGSSAVIRMKGEFAWKGLLAGVVLALLEVILFHLLQKRFPQLDNSSLKLDNTDCTETRHSEHRKTSDENTQTRDSWRINEKGNVELLFRSLWFLRAVIAVIIVEDFFLRSFLFPLAEKHLSYWAILVYALTFTILNFARTEPVKQFVLGVEAVILLFLFRYTHSLFFLVFLRAALEITKLPLLEISWNQKFQRFADVLNNYRARLGNSKLLNKQ